MGKIITLLNFIPDKSSSFLFVLG